MSEYYDDYGEGVDLKKTIKDSVKEFVQESQQEQAQRQAQEQQKEAQSMIEDACKEAGISVDYFNQFVGDKDVFQRQVKKLASKAAQAKGRKPKHQESVQGDFYKTSQPASVMGRTGRDFKERWSKGNQRSGTDAEVMDMLTDMIGNDPTFNTTK